MTTMNKIPSWESMAELFQELGYFPAETNDMERLCCYLEMETGISSKPLVTVVSNYYPNNSLHVSVVASNYARGTTDDGEAVNASSRTSLEDGMTHVLTVDAARRMLLRAEKAAKAYIQSLKALYGTK